MSRFRAVVLTVLVVLGLPSSAAHGQVQPPPQSASESACARDIASPRVSELLHAGAVPAGATVVGAVDPDERLTLAAGASHFGDIYLLNRAKLNVVGDGDPLADGPQTVIGGSIVLFDSAAMIVDGARVEIPPFAGTNYVIVATDHATIDINNSRVSFGDLPYVFHNSALCGSAVETVRHTTFLRPEITAEAPFIMDHATYHLQDSRGRFEITLSDYGKLEVVDLVDGLAGVYFHLPSGHLERPLTVAGGYGVTQTVRLPSSTNGAEATADVRNGNVVYALWLPPDADFTLEHSSVALFATARGTASIRDLRPGLFTDRRFDLGNGAGVRLVDSAVWLWNAYQEGPAGTLEISSSRIGEHVCAGAAGTVCRVHDSVIDGNGGEVSVQGLAELVLENTHLTTSIVATGTTITWLRSSPVDRPPPDPGHPTLPVSLQSRDDAVILLDDSPIGPGVERTVDGNGLIANATLTAPFDGAIVTHEIGVSGSAEAVCGPESGRCPGSYLLTVSGPTGFQKTVLATGEAIIGQDALLATWDPGLAPEGDYSIALDVWDTTGRTTSTRRHVRVVH